MPYRSKSAHDAEASADRLIQYVAEQTKTDPLALPPLYDAIDPDVLDVFLTSVEDGHIEFEYAGHRVRLESDGTVHLPHHGISPAPQPEYETTD